MKSVNGIVYLSPWRTYTERKSIFKFLKVYPHEENPSNLKRLIDFFPGTALRVYLVPGSPSFRLCTRRACPHAHRWYSRLCCQQPLLPQPGSVLRMRAVSVPMPTGGTLVFAVNSLFYLNQVICCACAPCLFRWHSRLCCLQPLLHQPGSLLRMRAVPVPMPTGGTLVFAVYSLFYLNQVVCCACALSLFRW